MVVETGWKESFCDSVMNSTCDWSFPWDIFSGHLGRCVFPAKHPRVIWLETHWRVTVMQILPHRQFVDKLGSPFVDSLLPMPSRLLNQALEFSISPQPTAAQISGMFFVFSNIQECVLFSMVSPNHVRPSRSLGFLQCKAAIVSSGPGSGLDAQE